MKIGLISDTHGFLEGSVHTYFKDCDQVWHLGDFGPGVSKDLSKKYSLFGVYGNIDDQPCRAEFPEYLVLEREGVKALLIHIGGYPGRYSLKAKELIAQHRPALFLSGHSHICKAMRDDKNKLLHLNPGAAGNHGFHNTKTIMTFEVHNGKISELKVIELGKRSSLA